MEHKTKIYRWIKYVQEHKDEIPYALQHHQVLSRALNDVFPLPDQAIKNFLVFIEYKKNILIASRLVSFDAAASFQSEVIQLSPLKSAGELSIYEGFIFSFERCFVYLLKYRVLCGSEKNLDLIYTIDGLQNILHLPANGFQSHMKQEAKSQGLPWFYLLENKLNSQVSCWKNDFSDLAHMSQFLVLRNDDPMFYNLCFIHLSGDKPLYQFFLVAIVWGFSDSAAVSYIFQNLTFLMKVLIGLGEEKTTDQDRVFMKWIDTFEHWRSLDFFGGEELNDMRFNSHAVNH